MPSALSVSLYVLMVCITYAEFVPLAQKRCDILAKTASFFFFHKRVSTVNIHRLSKYYS